MRHRMINNIGLGNPNECLLPNTWSENNKLNNIAKLIFQEILASDIEVMKEYGGFDFKVEVNEDGFIINFGIEPAYQYDELILYHIEKDKNSCKIILGKAEGSYGSDIKISKEFDYNNCNLKFKYLIDRWYDKLLETIESEVEES